MEKNIIFYHYFKPLALDMGSIGKSKIVRLSADDEVQNRSTELTKKSKILSLHDTATDAGREKR